MPAPLPLVSVVIPTYNRNELLCRTIQYLLNQDYDNYELIVVDQTREHEPETQQFLESVQQRIRYFFLARANVSAARNFGYEQSRGEIIMYFDDDMEIPPDVLRRVAQCYQDESVDGLTIQVLQDDAPFPDAGSPILKRVKVFGGIMSFHHKVFERIGGFEEWFAAQHIPSGEDADFSYRAVQSGFKLFLAQGIVVRHCSNQASGGCERLRLGNKTDGVSDTDAFTGLAIYWKNKKPGPIGAAVAFWRGYHAYVFNLSLFRTGFARAFSKNARFLRLFRQVLQKPWLDDGAAGLVRYAKPRVPESLSLPAKALCSFATLLPHGRYRLLHFAGAIWPAIKELEVEVSHCGRMHIDLTESVCGAIITNGCYPHQVGEDTVVSRIVKPGMVVFDIGANIGWYTCFMDSLMRGNGTIIAVEPMPRALRLLKKNANSRPSVQVVPCAIGAADGRAMLAESVALDLSYVHFSDSGPVKVVTIDNLTQRFGQPDFIKIDIEGAELMAIQGATRTLNSPGAPVLLIEYIHGTAARFSGYSLGDLLDIPKRAGYSFYGISHNGELAPLQDVHLDGSLTSNYLAVPPSRKLPELGIA
jgi:FkbM family methyltransferase